MTKAMCRKKFEQIVCSKKYVQRIYFVYTLCLSKWDKNDYGFTLDFFYTQDFGKKLYVL